MWDVVFYSFLFVGPAAGYAVGAFMTDSYWRLCGNTPATSRTPANSDGRYYYVVPEDEYVAMKLCQCPPAKKQGNPL